MAQQGRMINLVLLHPQQRVHVRGVHLRCAAPCQRKHWVVQGLSRKASVCVLKLVCKAWHAEMRSCVRTCAGTYKSATIKQPADRQRRT